MVLGCTHYPYLIPQIKKLVGNKVNIIDSGEAVAKQTKAILKKHNLLAETDSLKTHQFFINIQKYVLERILSDVSVNYKVYELNF